MRASNQSACFRAYQSIDPNGSPDAGACGTLWDGIVQLMDGIQGAGPRLNPGTWRDGLLRMGYRWYEDLPYAIGGGYGTSVKCDGGLVVASFADQQACLDSFLGACYAVTITDWA